VLVLVVLVGDAQVLRDEVRLVGLALKCLVGRSALSSAVGPAALPWSTCPGCRGQPTRRPATPSVTHSEVDDDKINNFGYTDDSDGVKVPRAAHIRKMTPRGDELPESDSSKRRRMLRRREPLRTQVHSRRGPLRSAMSCSSAWRHCR
jgi:deferrochelatase/peroxidase EfeB